MGAAPLLLTAVSLDRSNVQEKICTLRDLTIIVFTLEMGVKNFDRHGDEAKKAKQKMAANKNTAKETLVWSDNEVSPKLRSHQGLGAQRKNMCKVDVEMEVMFVVSQVKCTKN